MIKDIFELQKENFKNNNNVSIEERNNRLDKLSDLIKDNKEEIVAAIKKDFGNRSEDETYIAEIIPSLNGIRYIKKNLKKWMKPSRRDVEMFMQPAEAKVVFQPLGVVGIMVPWNYPLMLAVVPMSYALSAGNNVLVKMSEYTPEFSNLFERLISEYFKDDVVSVINGDSKVAEEFSKLPFDHLLFTGSTAIGKKVMENSAKNLTPVTLELGGKSPAIIAPDFDVSVAVDRICFGKSFNSGQTCISPDYVLVHEDKVDEFVEKYKETFNRFFPEYEKNDDYTSIINEIQMKRLENYIQDAKDKGADVIPMVDNIDKNSKKMPPYLVLNTNNKMLVGKEEIFGPILPILTYKDMREVKELVEANDKPLAIYLFTNDKKCQREYENNTLSGGLCINDTLSHIVVDDIPFGGVGNSGMGHYHGHEGFLTFSKSKGVFKKSSPFVSKVLNPPYNSLLIRVLNKILN